MRFLFAAACVAAAIPVARPAGRGASVVVLNGKIVTVDARSTIAEALAIRDGVFVYIGSNEEARKYITGDTRIIDADGNTVLPGLIETHAHAIEVARSEAREPFRQLSSLAEVQHWLRERAARTPPGQWIRIPRVDLTRFREGRFPTREELDQATREVPVVFDWSYAGLNQVQVLNTAALAAARITRDTPDPPKGRIIRDAEGNPTGMIRNARSLIAGYLPSGPRVDQQAVLGHLENVHAHYNAVGITSINDRRTGPETYYLYSALKEQGRLTVRATITIGIGYGNPDPIGQIAKLPFGPGEGDEWLRVGPLKIRVDGGLLYGTARLREPYIAAGSARYYEIHSDMNRGELVLPAARVTEIIRAGHKAGWQMAAHVAGDAGVDVVLDALEAADRDSPIAPRRFNFIHAYLPNPDAVRRAAKLGAVVDTQPMWYYKDGDALVETLGGNRAARLIGLREWLNGGVKVSINADHMTGLDPDRALNPYNPFLAMYVAVTRRTESGRIHGPGQRVSRLEALRMVTIDAAYLSFDEKNRGSIESGKLGDLTVLSGDFLNCTDEEIRHMKVAATVVGGKVVYERTTQ